MEENPLLKWFKDYWFLILFVGMVIIAYTNTERSIKELESRQLSVEAKVEVQIDSQNKVQVQLSQIQTDLLWIKQRLGN